MKKKSKPQKQPQAPASTALLVQDIREIRRQIRRLEDPVRFVVYERPIRGATTRLFLDVSGDAFWLGDWTRATLFKQKHIAQLVAQAYSEQRQRALQVARVTITAWGKRGRGRL